MTESGKFSHAHEALMFAFNYSNQQYAQTPMSKLMRGELLGGGSGMSRMDGAAQAGMIKQLVDALARPERNYLVAVYAPRTQTQPYSGDTIMAPEWRQAIVDLTEYVMTGISGMSPFRLRQALVMQHFRAAGNLKEIAAQQGYHRNTVATHARHVRESLKALQVRAECSIDDAMKRAGVIELATA